MEKTDWKAVLAESLKHLLSDAEVYNEIRYRDPDPERDAKLEISEGLRIPLEVVEQKWNDERLIAEDWQLFVGVAVTEEEIEREIASFYLRTCGEGIACMRNHAGKAQRTMIAIVLSLVQRMEEILGRKARILDYGGGAGTLAILLKQSGLDVGYFDVGGDVNKLAEWRFRKRDLDIETYSAHDSQYPIEENYDAVIALEVLEHVFDLPETLRHICSLVKPDGFLIFSESCSDTSVPLHLEKNKIYGGKAVVAMTENLGFEQVDSCELMPYKDGREAEYLIGILKIFRREAFERG